MIRQDQQDCAGFKASEFFLTGITVLIGLKFVWELVVERTC
jgi:hypothetical protein